MHYLDLTLPTPAENLALDEALLEEAEASVQPIETLRLWESSQMLVVVGRSSHVSGEVQLEACQKDDVPVLRRTSGGASIVAGPGCLMYALVLSYELRPALRSISESHREVLRTMVAALGPLAAGVCSCGTSDLALGEYKFSGNSVRCRRRTLLYHGTLLYDFPLEMISRYLAMPPRMPDYRETRPHDRFVTNLPVSVAAMRQAIRNAWDAQEVRYEWPRDRTAQLVCEKYSQPAWNGLADC